MFQPHGLLLVAPKEQDITAQGIALGTLSVVHVGSINRQRSQGVALG
jgi:hypothetical protein